MTLDQLRVFVAVAEREHTTRAAEHLHLSQSAVSAAIAAIEGRYATRLFDRVGRGICITEAGRAFLPAARDVLASVTNAESTLANLSELRHGTLRIRASQTIASYWLPIRLVAFRRAFPGIKVDLTIGNTETVSDAVRNGAVEIGFVEGKIRDPLLHETEVSRDDLVLIANPKQTICCIAGVTSAHLQSMNWVTRERGSGTRSALEGALAAAGLSIEQVQIALELPSNEAVRSAVEAGAGATVLSRSVVNAQLESGSLVHIDFPVPSRAFSVLLHKERFPSRAVDALVAMMV